NLGEDLWILSGYSREPMPKGIAARVRFSSRRARSAALSSVDPIGRDPCLRTHEFPSCAGKSGGAASLSFALLAFAPPRGASPACRCPPPPPQRVRGGAKKYS